MASDRAQRFLALHHERKPLLMPNAWDAGSAKMLESLGFEAIATTSSGYAATLGRLDGSVSREEALAHAQSIVAASDVPVSADLENGFADEPAGVAETVARALEVGLAGCSVEDFTGDPDNPIYELELARARIAAAAEVAHGGPVALVLTARAENHIRGRDDLKDTIARLSAYEQAGADVLFAPGLADRDDIGLLVAALGRPLSVLLVPGAPTVGELAALGVSRISVGGAFAFAAYAALIEAATELRDAGTASYLTRSATGAESARAAFGA